MQRLLIIPLGLLLLLAGAVWWSEHGEQGRADFVFIDRGEVNTLDLNRMSWLQDIRVAYGLWEGLYTLDQKTLEAIPGCADRIELSPDKLVYTFHIRTEAKWTNGEAVLAKDFVFPWRRMLEEPGDYTYLFYCIAGAEEYQKAYGEGKEADFGSVGIKEVEDRTLRVTLKQPVTYFPDLCAFPSFFPLHRKSMEEFAMHDKKSGRVATYDKVFTRPPHLVSNGPYRLAAWEFKQKLRLVASEYYWDRANVHSRTIDIFSADDPLWGYLKYRDGAVDWLADATGQIGSELRQKNDADLHVFPAFGTYFYSINCRATLPDGTANPFADKRVRQAFSMAIDRRPIVDTITRLGEQPAFTYIPLGVFPRYVSPKGLPHDVEKARALLAEAGYPGGKGFPSVSILFNNEAQHRPVAEVISRQWKDKLGVAVQLEPLEIKLFRQRLHTKQYTIARASWFGDYNDPSTFTDKYLSTSDNNDSDWKNKQYDELCAQAAVEADPARRLEIFSQAETLLLDEQPIIPVYYYVNCYLYPPRVKGLPLHARNMILLKWVEVQK